MKNKLVIIDGSSVFYRSYYALPLLTNSEGEYSNAVYGFAIQILHIIEDIKPTHIAVAFDVSKKTFRSDIYSEYKSTRKPMPEELRSQIEPLKKMLKLMNIVVAEKEGLEGDDIIGILSDKFADNTETIIVTGDRDTFQLIDKDTKVYFTKKGTSELKKMGVEELVAEYGVSPKGFIDVKALQGDTSDNIPGVAGIGPKTATDLIIKYGDIDGVYNHIEDFSGKLKENLINGKDSAYMSKKLATIVRKADYELELEDCKYDYPFSVDVYELFKKYEFKTLLRKQNVFDMGKVNNRPKKYNIKNCAKKEELQILAKNIEKIGKFAIYFDTSDIHLSYGEDENLLHLNLDLFMQGINENEFFEIFGKFFESKQIEKICFDSKKIMYKLNSYGLVLENYFDVSIAKSLVDGTSVDAVEDVFGEAELSNIASNMFEFESIYSKKIEDNNLQYLFNNVEIPLAKVLFSMENDGFCVDREKLDKLTEKYQSELFELENKIYELAGEKFNINSPKQLAQILYGKIGLSHKKKMSTSADNLEAIENEHEIVGVVLRFRKVAKLLSTYLVGLKQHLAKDGKVHTYFKQTLTTTGRLSSVEPNLQNIPIRSEESKEIRSLFVASNKDNILVDADYSQIELRLLAHFSKDPMFVDAFAQKQDIHARTASEVFGVPTNLVTSQMRRTAKIVNFGIIYGISQFGLAEDLKIKAAEAKIFIDNFYSMHPAVKEYMDNSISIAKQTGFASTLFGRKRKMDDINVSNYMVRSRAERASQNMPLQGTAADIIKIAMVNTFNALKEAGFKARLIMQVHDELIIDCPIEEKEKVSKLLKEQMESAAKLAVPLEAEVSSSYRWSNAH